MNESQIAAWAKTNKKELVNEIIGNAKPQKDPMAIIMAGIPGAGKTEFLTHLIADMDEDIVVIDLDSIVSKFKDYKPENYYKYRKPASVIVSAVLDKVLKNKLSFALDGTFTHPMACNNVDRALEHGFEVNLFFFDQDNATAWELIKARRVVTGRPIDEDGFFTACLKVVPRVQCAILLYGKKDMFFMSAVRKNNLEPDFYEYIEGPEAVDKYLAQTYHKRMSGRVDLMDKQGQRSSKLSIRIVLRAIDKSIKDQKTLLARAKKLSVK